MTRVTYNSYAENNPQTAEATGMGTVPPTFEMSRVNTGAIRWNNGSEEVESVGVSRYQHTTEGTAGAAVASTLAKVNGKESVELIPGNPGSRTLVETAVRDGIIRRGPGGQWEDVTSPAGAPTAAALGEAPPAETAADPGAAAFDPEDDSLWAQDIEPLPQHSYDAAIASMVNVVAHGTGSLEDTALALARNAAIQPELARDYVDQGYALYERAVARAVAPMGLTGERLQQFYDSTREAPAKLQDAIQRLVHMRDPSGFTALAADWKAQNTDLSMYKAAGMQAMVDRTTGEVLVQHGKGPWVKASSL